MTDLMCIGYYSSLVALFLSIFGLLLWSMSFPSRRLDVTQFSPLACLRWYGGGIKHCLGRLVGRRENAEKP